MSKIMKQPSNLISSLLFLIVGLILFLNPNGIVAFISYIFGIIMITIGVVKIIEAVKAKDDINHDSVLTFGIICVVIGFILIICSSIIELVFRIFIGAWILISGINKLVISLGFTKRYYFKERGKNGKIKTNVVVRNEGLYERTAGQRYCGRHYCGNHCTAVVDCPGPGFRGDA